MQDVQIVELDELTYDISGVIRAFLLPGVGSVEGEKSWTGELLHQAASISINDQPGGLAVLVECAQ